MDGPVRVYVGTDRTQLFATRVLEHSMRRRTALPVELHPMHELRLPEPADRRHGARTPFSFARFAIPALAGRADRALYLDADMLVLKDVAELWGLPFAGAKVLVQEDPPNAFRSGEPRRRQSSVMLLDCGALDWDAAAIIAGLGSRYSYEQLMYEFCLLREDEIRGAIPSRWNCLERLAADTCLIHYTDMDTQPWVSARNPHVGPWLDEVRDMLADGTLARAELEREIADGHARPSLLAEIDGKLSAGDEAGRAALEAIDRRAGFVKHRALAERLERGKGWLAPLRRAMDRFRA
jgi:hypothetical protein